MVKVELIITDNSVEKLSVKQYEQEFGLVQINRSVPNRRTVIVLSQGEAEQLAAFIRTHLKPISRETKPVHPHVETLESVLDN